MSTTINNRLAALLADPFESMLNQCSRESAGAVRNVLTPRPAPMTLWEDEQGVQIEVDVPGLTHEQLDLTVENGKLTIRGERKQPEREANLKHDERRFGEFERVVTLPETIDTASIEAELNDGVLSISLKKKPEAQPHRVAVKYHGGVEPVES